MSQFYCLKSVLIMIVNSSLGVIAFDLTTQTGFWMVHSVPKWPSTTRYSFDAKNNGQTILCMSFPLRTIGNIGKLSNSVTTVYCSVLISL